MSDVRSIGTINRMTMTETRPATVAPVVGVTVTVPLTVPEIERALAAAEVLGATLQAGTSGRERLSVTFLGCGDPHAVAKAFGTVDRKRSRA